MRTSSIPFLIVAIAVGGFAHGLLAALPAAVAQDVAPAEASQGRLLVLNKTDATLSFVDPAKSALVSVVGT
ncbi:MAG TPA: hypothetical protein VM509_00605, partial [Planctomycetota bacterium]|nr:hypothetical protein [Planctomycetota bacterium]